MQSRFPIQIYILPLAATFAFGGTMAMADEAKLQALYEAAQAEGDSEVAIYAPAIGSYAGLFKEFEARFPAVKVVGTDMSGAALFSRLEAEAASNTPGVDIVATGTQDFAVLTGAEYLQSFTPADIEQIPASFASPDKNWYTFQLVPLGTVVNVAQAPDFKPTKWDDLLDPALKGKMSITSPHTLTTAPMGMMQMLEMGAISDDWIKAFAAQAPVVNTSTSATMLSVSQGQYNVAPIMPLSVFNGAKNKGAPVEFFYFEDGNPVMQLSLGLMKSAPHPKAGELFASWVLSEEGAKILAELTGSKGTHINAPLIPGMPEGQKLLALPADQLATAVDHWMAGPAKAFPQ